jgi:hypothetical protein
MKMKNRKTIKISVLQTNKEIKDNTKSIDRFLKRQERKNVSR